MITYALSAGDIKLPKVCRAMFTFFSLLPVGMKGQSVAASINRTSSYQTDDKETFETKMLRIATRNRPANIRMTALKDYNPCNREELALQKGQRVKVLYKTNDWVYAVTKKGDAGYIPYNYLRPSRKYAGYQSKHIDMPYSGGRHYGEKSPVMHQRPSVGKPAVSTITRAFLEELVVIHDFLAQDEDEVFISKGERVKVFNADDPFWLYVETAAGMQGFVPRSCCSFCNHPCKWIYDSMHTNKRCFN